MAGTGPRDAREAAPVSSSATLCTLPRTALQISFFSLGSLHCLPAVRESNQTVIIITTISPKVGLRDIHLEGNRKMSHSYVIQSTVPSDPETGRDHKFESNCETYQSSINQYTVLAIQAVAHTTSH